MSSDSLLAPGTLVAGYEVDSLLGQGGMAVVYRATQRSLKRTVALKVLANELSGDESFRERFEREGQLQAGIDHLHIVPVYEAGQSEHGLFLAMRLIQGPTLKQLITSGELEPRRSLRLLAQVAQALDAAHAAGLIHRDVKPQNILVGENDHTYLADFGLIKAPDETRLTGTGQFMGTIDYVAPEQIRGEAAGPASDEYALAAVLYECLTGEVPFKRASETATLTAQLTEPPPRVSERNPSIPPAMDEVIALGMAKDPAQRTLPTAELIRAAGRALSGGDAVPEPGGVAPLSQPTRMAGGPVIDTSPGQMTTRARVVGAAAPTVQSAAAGATVQSAAAPETGVPSGTGERARPGVGRLLAIVAGLAVVAIVGGYLIGHAGKKSSGAKSSNSATVGHLQLAYPAGWQLHSTGATVPGMSFANAVTLATIAPGGQLAAGEVSNADGPALLPAGFAARISGGVPAPQRVLLGGTPAYRYSDLTVRGLSGPTTVYVVPTSSGVATLACLPSSSGTASFDQRCGQVAATLHLVGVHTYPFAPSSSYAHTLSTEFAQLRTAVAAASGRLRSATTPAAQTAAARQLSQAYAKAADALRGATISPMDARAHAAAIAALTQLSGGYAHAAAAASSQSNSGYASAGRKIRAAGAALAAALAQLGKLGYHVSS